MKFKSLLLLLVFISFHSFAQSYYGNFASSRVNNAQELRYTKQSKAPSYILFNKENQPSIASFSSIMAAIFKSSPKTEFKKVSSLQDDLGYNHISYQQYFNEVKIENAVYVAHSKNGKIESISGYAVIIDEINTSAKLSKIEAVAAAKTIINASKYKWELPLEEYNIKLITDNPNATYYPKGELVILPKNTDYYIEQNRLVYRLDIYAHEPMSHAEYYIDAENGQLLFKNELIHTANSNGVANTAYSGTQTITTDSVNSTTFRLRNTERGIGIVTLDCNTGTSYGAAVDFLDSNNIWNNFNTTKDEYATDAHWGAEKTYDYFLYKHNRNSIDGNGFALYSYVHYDLNYANAFWDGIRMSYGDGSPTSVLNTPLTALDIAGHEITHGLTSRTANLIYQRESGALNESFSDIFGTAIEFYARPNNADWLIGDDLGGAIRSMSNPNQYGDPDTYGGTSWRNPNCGTPSNANDQCGVHTNSGVQNYWFYLLVNGGSGINDLNNSFSVNGIGIDTASKIAFRNLTVYLSRNSTYADARFFSIKSAVDLYGACSPQVEAVTNAWYAVGVGAPYVAGVQADFYTSDTSSCKAPFRVRFQNNSNNAVNFVWDFGDGTSSTLLNPVKTYNNIGNYSVKLISNGGACGTDSLIKTAYISVDTANLCNVSLQNGVNATQTECFGKLFDNGGSTLNYEDNANSIITIAPFGASTVSLNFLQFDVEAGQANSCNYDYMQVFDGSSVNDPLMGTFCNNNPPTSLTSTRGAITIRFISDVGTNGAGFEIDWSCSMPTTAPTADFYSNTDTSCSGNVQFYDNSLDGPSNWLWSFGDNTTSTSKNPLKVYTANGTYSVKLVVSNSFGNDSIIKNAQIVVRRPKVTSFKGDTACPNVPATLKIVGSGHINWYDAATAGNLVGSGNPFTTPIISATTTYYAEAFNFGAADKIGPTSNTIGGGNNFTGQQHLIFTAFKGFLLKSVLVYANGAGNRTIELRDSSGVVLQSKTVNIPSGQQRVSLNFEIPIGVNYQLGLSNNSTVDLFRNNSGVQYPYSNDLMSITKSSASTAPLNYYYFFYDWEVQEYCKFSRIPVTAIFDPNCVATSIKELKNNFDLKLLPNPTSSSSKLKVSLNQSVNAEIFISNLNGQLVKSIYNGAIASGNSTFTIDAAQLENGIYFVSFKSKEINKVIKLIVID